MPITQKEYLEEHIPHRLNLLITFRERFFIDKSLKPDELRDFFRCSKDISMLMVRFLLGELGINFKKPKDNPSDDITESWHSKFGIKQLTKQEVINDSRYSNIKIVLKAANRALAHLEPKDVNHQLKLDSNNHILIDAINFTEEKIVEKMYISTGYDYNLIMAKPENDMKRKPIKK